jgi:hypothetical protein
MLANEPTTENWKKKEKKIKKNQCLLGTDILGFLVAKFQRIINWIF